MNHNYNFSKYIFLCLCLLAGTNAYAYDACIDGICYNLHSSNKTAEVTYSGWPHNNDYNTSCGTGLSNVDVRIPSIITYNDVEYTVTAIGNYAFYDVEASIRMSSVTIPSTVTTIGEYAFHKCVNLTSFAIPNSVTRIGKLAFYGCTGLTSVTISDCVTSIGGDAFDGCSGLTSITIPNSVTNIGDRAFGQCSSLTSITVGEGNTVYDSRNNCNAIIETETNTLIAGCKNTVIPSSVTCIGFCAFFDCRSLTSITIPNSVTSIGGRAFDGCRGLTSITISNSVTSIGNSALSGCSSLTSVTIPNSVTCIGNSALSGCSSLTSVTIPNSVTNIGYSLFSGCRSLTSITIPASVTSIGNGAFSGCSSLTSVTIPNSVVDIGHYTFSDCSVLKDVYCYAENIPQASSGFYDSFKQSPIESATLHVPSGSLEAYRTTAPWSGFGTIVAIEDDEVTATDVSAMSYAIYALPASARKGSQTTLSVCMKNTQPITLWQADLTLPSGFSLATDSYGDPMVSISGSRTSTSRHSISTSTLSDGSIRILCSSNSNKTFTSTDGEVATITLNVASNVNEGDYAVKFNNIKLVEANETKHEVDEVVSVITVKNYTLGDVNNDGSIDGADLVGIVNYILDRPTSGNIREAADVNKDGVIDGSDYVREVNAILGKIVLSVRRKAQRAGAPEADYAVYANDFEGIVGQQATLCLSMKNNQPVTLWQADLVLPEGVSIATDDFDDPMVYITGGRTTEARHAIATNTLPDGCIRILCSSSSNKTFTGTDGEVATIMLGIVKDMKLGEYPVALKNILIVEADETRHTCDPVECTLSITQATGISPLLTSHEEEGQVYNIAGQQVNKPLKGINIIRMSDGTTRKVFIK